MSLTIILGLKRQRLEPVEVRRSVLARWEINRETWEEKPLNRSNLRDESPEETPTLKPH